MREYKFRVFYKGAFTYFDLDLLNDESRAFYINEIKDNQVMQYTGLKDKNGVETYEGDIVQVEELGVGTIEYIESYFRIFKPYIFSVNLCNYTSTIELEPKNKVEVIGNIYENPELLK